jgi:hypothetical protein
VRIIATTTRINSMMCSNDLNRGLRRDDLFILTGWPWISWRNCNSRVGETEVYFGESVLGSRIYQEGCLPFYLFCCPTHSAILSVSHCHS